MGTKNTLEDLNNLLFEEMERLNDGELNGEELKEELARARGMTSLGAQIISNAQTVLAAAKFADEKMNIDQPVPRMLLKDGEKK